MQNKFTVNSVVFNPGENFSWVFVNLYALDMNDVQSSIGMKYVKVKGEHAEITQELLALTQAELHKADLAPEPIVDDPLALSKRERWEAIVRIRDGLETKGFPYMDKWFDSDERSVQRINTTAQAAMAAKSLGQQFDTVWTAADNAGVPMTVDQVIGLPVALALHANELHTKARDLRERINSAQTIMEVMQCYWEGYEKMPVGALPLN